MDHWGTQAMSFKKLLTTGVVSTALIASNAVAFAGAAQAENWNGGHGKYRSERNFNDGRWNKGDRYAYEDRGRHYKKDKSDKKIARGVAIGLGVLLIGSILASEAHR
jgi:hypothetical protein